MADQGMPSSYETTTTTHATRQIGFYPDYIRTIPGILKIVECVLCLIVFICASVWPNWAPYGGGWVQFVSMSALIATGVLLVFYLTALIDKLPPIMVLVEFIYYVVYSVFYLIASIVASVKGGWHSSIGAAAFFSFAATAVYAVDTFFQFRAWRSGGSTFTVTRTTTTTTTTTQGSNVEAGKQVY